MRPDLQAIRMREAEADPGPWVMQRGLTEEEASSLLFSPNNVLVMRNAKTQKRILGIENAEFIVSARSDIPNLLAYIDYLEKLPLVQTIVERDKEIQQLNEACGIMAGKIVALESIQEAQKLEVKRSPIEIDIDSDVYVSLLELAYTTKLSLSEIVENCLRGYFAARGGK